MSDVLIAAAFVAGLGLVCAVLLVLAAKFMSVKEDERLPKVRACLPGANCGACGFAGCDGYAKALIEDEDLKCNLCVPGASAVSKELSEILGRKYESTVKTVAVVRCSGNCKATKPRFEYVGIKRCGAANMFYGGAGSCSYGCIGIGDCAMSCPQSAICLDSGIARVDTELCIGCGICTKVCPHGIITLLPVNYGNVVVCASNDKGAVTRKFCTNGCIGCGKCQRTCKYDAIKVINNLAVIDYNKCTSCGECVGVCPVNCIRQTKSV